MLPVSSNLLHLELSYNWPFWVCVVLEEGDWVWKDRFKRNSDHGKTLIEEKASTNKGDYWTIANLCSLVWCKCCKDKQLSKCWNGVVQNLYGKI